MAATSNPNHLRNLTPPISSQDGQGSWEFAVPLQDERYLDTSDAGDEDANTAFNTTRPSYSNNISRSSQKRSQATDAHTSKRVEALQENNHLTPALGGALSGKQGDISGTGSESDSLLDLYKRSEGRLQHSGLGHGEKVPMNSRSHWSVDQLDESNWIHRDKLAQIESRELEEAGIRTRELNRGSTPKPRRQSIEEQPLDVEPEQKLDEPIALQEIYRPKAKPSHDSYDPYGSMYNPDFRFVEDTSRDRDTQTNSARSSSTRPLTSRIPVPKPTPVSSPGERDSRMSKGRKDSNASDIEGKPRVRSGSVGSQVLLDDTDENGIYTPVHNSNGNYSQASPQKAKLPSKATPVSAARKTSASRTPSVSKARSGSGSISKRPGTSSGLSRPTTAKPEGEAPWIATMYKPDPSLPPDQQIIPTHAKRMQQEQWEREGKTGSVYDKDFRLLNTEFLGKPETGQAEGEPKSPEKKEETHSSQWPLSPQTSARPGTSGTEHGGYKTIPKIQSPQNPARSTPTPKPAPSPKLQQNPPIQVQEPTPDKDKGCCGGCVIL